MHLVHFEADRLSPIQVHNTAVLRKNVRTLLAVLVWLAVEAANCTSVGSGAVDHEFGAHVGDIKRRAFLLFDEAISQ